MIDYECLGCSEHCKMSSGVPMTGCVYEDGGYDRDADIWIEINASDSAKNALRKRIKDLN